MHEYASEIDNQIFNHRSSFGGKLGNNPLTFVSSSLSRNEIKLITFYLFLEFTLVSSKVSAVFVSSEGEAALRMEIVFCCKTAVCRRIVFLFASAQFVYGV